MAYASDDWWSRLAEAKQNFLQELRNARLSAQKDAEAFDELLFVFERLGCYLLKEAATLGRYKDRLLALAGKSALGGDLDAQFANWHSDKAALYKLVNHARNDAFHQGAGARHLTEHAIELALLFEDALMNDNDDPMTKLREIMVRSPIVAEPWQPISFVRQVMLTNSFSTLPIYFEGEWWVITDAQVAAFLRDDPGNRPKRLGMSVKDAKRQWNSLLEKAAVEKPDRPIGEVAKAFAKPNASPFILVLDKAETAKQSKELLGIVTAFDIL